MSLGQECEVCPSRELVMILGRGGGNHAVVAYKYQGMDLSVELLWLERQTRVTHRLML